MKPRPLTVTTIGLSVRAELRLKSLLELVNARTTHQWSFVEQTTAHVAICDPASALSTLAIKRSLNGPMRFVSLVSDESQSAAGTDFIRDPIRAGDLIDLLNHVSAILDKEPLQDSRATNGPAAGEERDPFPVAMAVRRLAKSATDEVFQLQTEILQLYVVPSARSVLLTQPIDQNSISRLAEPGVHVDIRQLPASHTSTLVAGGAQACKVDALLWRLGLHSTNSRLLPEFPADGFFKLRRWPDFGRVEHTAEHLHLAARLVRQQISAIHSTTDEWRDCVHQRLRPVRVA